MFNQDTEKSAEQVQLSNATKAKLFAYQNILYIKYRAKRSWLQRLLRGRQ